MIVAFAFLQEAGILCMQDLPLAVEHHKNGEAETGGIVQPGHHLIRQLSLLCTLFLPGIIIHMNIDKVIVNHLADGGIVGDEVCKAQAPGTPVAAYLTDDELAIGLGLEDGLVDLLKGIDIFVINLFQRRLGLNGY